MIRYLLTGGMALLLSTPLIADNLVEQATTSELHLSTGKIIARVTRDNQGRVTHLRLTDVKLLPADIAEIAAQKHLRILILSRTNVSDRDVAKLTQCEHLEHLNLSVTDVTDAAITSILQMKKLKTLCLGSVGVTPDGIEKLKAANRSRDKEHTPYLRWGYSERKQAPSK